MGNGEDSMRLLRQLDETTDWEQSGDVLSANDPPDEEDGHSGVAVLPRTGDGSDGGSGGLASGEEVESILSCVGDMVKNGDIEHILVVVNTMDFDQLLFTTIDRNDLIIGCLETAKMNWFNTQVELQNMGEEGEDAY